MKGKEKENLVYLKLDYGESIETKRKILQSQKSFLVLNGILRNFIELKEEELKVKTKLQKKLKELASNIRTLQTRIPEVELPEKLRNSRKSVGDFEDEEIKSYKPILKSSKPKSYDGDIESQLREIQDKLNQLS